jgi:hypothetical protein
VRGKEKGGGRKEGATAMGDALFKSARRGGGRAGRMAPHGDSAEGEGLATGTWRPRGGTWPQRPGRGRIG